MRKVAIVQARMGSTRLPGKVLLDLGGQPVLAWVVRAARAIPGLDEVVVATTVSPDDDAIAGWCARSGVACHRGPEQDVLARYLGAAAEAGADLVLRITSDCPLLDPQVCGELLALMTRTGAAFATNCQPASYPDGLDCEGFTREALAAAHAEARLPSDREHVAPFIHRNRDRFSAQVLTCPIPGLAGLRWTLDTPADLAFLRAVVARLGDLDRPPAYLEVLRVLEAEPALLAGNAEARNTGYTRSIRAERADTARRYDRSERLLERASRVIPLGSQTFSKSWIQYPAGASPLFLSHGRGGTVWDVDGNEYVDLVCGLLPVVLGYQDPDVDAAVRRQLTSGVSFSLATALEAELAERIVEVVPCAEMVRFAKNGTDATSAAVRIARAATGRERVAVCGYHGWQDWYIGSTSRHKGVPAAVRGLTHPFTYNDPESLRSLLERHPGEFAAVILEPMNVAEPAAGFLETVRDLAHAHGAVLVFDEVITGFRFALGGAQELFGVTPDLASFGKALGNGMPIAAVAGRADLMAEMEHIFFSSTFGGEALSLAAGVAVVDKMRREPVIETLRRSGERLAEAVSERLRAHGLEETIALAGHPSWKILLVRDDPRARKQAIRTLLLRELLRAGVLVNASHNVCYAHSETDLARVVGGYDHALAVVARELETGRLEERLGGPVIEPIFSVR